MARKKLEDSGHRDQGGIENTDSSLSDLGIVDIIVHKISLSTVDNNKCNKISSKNCVHISQSLDVEFLNDFVIFVLISCRAKGEREEAGSPTITISADGTKRYCYYSDTAHF